MCCHLCVYTDCLTVGLLLSRGPGHGAAGWVSTLLLDLDGAPRLACSKPASDRYVGLRQQYGSARRFPGPWLFWESLFGSFDDAVSIVQVPVDSIVLITVSVIAL